MAEKGLEPSGARAPWQTRYDAAALAGGRPMPGDGFYPGNPTTCVPL